MEWVLYDIDRNFENIPDVYWAPAKEAGFQLRFNEDQVLDTVFCYITASEGFSPISPQIVGVPIYATFDEAEATCRLNGDKYSTSNPVNGPRFHKLWLCVEGPVRRTHYQFASGILSLITLMLPEA
ncbi:MAG TPA: hypothetical protein VGJ75_25020 [Dongiaceae bacterium]